MQSVVFGVSSRAIVIATPGQCAVLDLRTPFASVVDRLRLRRSSADFTASYLQKLAADRLAGCRGACYEACVSDGSAGHSTRHSTKFAL
jgi:hypothetical protein